MSGKVWGPFPGLVNSVHDGDTFNVTLSLDGNFDYGFGFKGNMHTEVTLSCRVYGINAPELQVKDPTTGKMVDNPAGIAARDFARSLLLTSDGAPLGTIGVLSHGWDKYGGRFDGEVTLHDGSDLATRMVDAGHAVLLP